MRDAHQLGAELQDVGQRQVADVGVRLAAGTEKKREEGLGAEGGHGRGKPLGGRETERS